MKPTDKGPDTRASIQAPDIIQRIHDTGVAAAGTNNQASFRFDPQGQIIFNWVRLRTLPVEKKGAASIFVIRMPRDGSRKTDTSALNSQRAEERTLS